MTPTSRTPPPSRAAGPPAPTRDPLDPGQMISLRHWDAAADHPALAAMDGDALVDAGWGRLLFGQTFSSAQALADALREEQAGQRDLALYLRDPQVVVALAPQDLFIDPSYTYRLALDRALPAAAVAVSIRPARPGDAATLRRIYGARRMVPPPPAFFDGLATNASVQMLVAEDPADGHPIGAITGVDHVQAFRDPDGGSSLWALAVDPQSTVAGVGEALTLAIARLYKSRGRHFLDLSVQHDNAPAIALYERLGFVRVPVYCVKTRNAINEPLFLGPDPAGDLNIYAGILVREARRRGIGVEVLDAGAGYFRLSLGGRSITCRESLTELTSAIAMSRCDDKRLTLRVLAAAGLSVPEQIEAGDAEALAAFLQRHPRVVVKPARGEQGRGVQVDLTAGEVPAAIARAAEQGEAVIVEQMAEGEDLRIIVIDHQVVAAASRRPAAIVGDGQQDIATLIDRHSRRRQAATAGESRIPVDDETRRCLAGQGLGLDSVPAQGQRVAVRRTANLHTGGTIHDVTAQLHPALREAAETASRVLEIPVVGFDFLVRGPDQPGYVIIEANERPGLANHEPQPTAERFIDLLFPQTRAAVRISEPGGARVD